MSGGGGRAPSLLVSILYSRDAWRARSGRPTLGGVDGFCSFLLRMERDLVFSPLPPEPVVVSILFLVLLRSTWFRAHVTVDCDLVASLCMDVSWLFGCPGSFLGFGFGKGGSSPCPSPHPRSSMGRSRIGANRTPILPRLSSDRSCAAEEASSRFFGLSPAWERVLSE